MACEGNRTFFGLGISFIILAFLLDIVGVACPYWIYAAEDDQAVYAGLWKLCASGKTPNFKISGCTDFTDIPDWFKAVRAFGIIGIVVFLTAAGFALLRIRWRERYFVLVVSIVLSFIGALFMLVSVALYNNKIYDLVKPSSIFHPHFAFVFCVLSICCSSFAGICMIKELWDMYRGNSSD